MLARLLFVVLALSLIGCGAKPNPAAPEALPRSDARSSSTETKDPELEAAIAKARTSLDSFVTRLQHPQRGEVFAVEAAFPTITGAKEYLWVGDAAYKDGAFSGNVTSKPKNATDVKYGQEVTVKRTDVTDWMILKSGKSEGGYTVEVLMRREAQPK